MEGMTIRIERIRRGLTQTELAKRLGVSQELVSKLERGIYQTSNETSKKIRQLFKDMDKGDGNANTNIRDL